MLCTTGVDKVNPFNLISFQIRSISDLTHEPRRILQSVPNDDIPLKHQQELIREAAKLGSTFEDIVLKFADAHFAINHRRALSPDDLNRIGYYSTPFNFCCEVPMLIPVQSNNFVLLLQICVSRSSWHLTERVSLNPASHQRCTYWRTTPLNNCPGSVFDLASQ